MENNYRNIRVNGKNGNEGKEWKKKAYVV